jgi:uncharacterized membrane protein
MRRQEFDPPRSFWSVVVTPNNGADLNYIADRVAKLARVDSVMIQERRVTAVWREGDNGGGGGGGGGGSAEAPKSR